MEDSFGPDVRSLVHNEGVSLVSCARRRKSSKHETANSIRAEEGPSYARICSVQNCIRLLLRNSGAGSSSGSVGLLR